MIVRREDTMRRPAAGETEEKEKKVETEIEKEIGTEIVIATDIERRTETETEKGAKIGIGNGIVTANGMVGVVTVEEMRATTGNKHADETAAAQETDRAGEKEASLPCGPVLDPPGLGK